MSSVSRILKNSLFLAIARMLNLLSGLGIYALIGRLLGANGLGQFSFILAYTGMFVFLSSLGIHLYITREIARRRDQVQLCFGNALALVLLLSPLVYSALLLVARAFLSVEPGVQIGIAIAGLYLVLGTLLLLFSAVFQAFEHMELHTASMFTESAAAILLCGVVLLAGGGVVGVIIAYVGARVLALGVSVLLFTQQIGPLPRLSLCLPLTRKAVRGSLPFALNILTTTVYVQVDLLLLNLWGGDTVSGYYRAATSLVIPLSIVAHAVNRALFPDMARSFISSLPRLNKAVESSIYYLFVLGWPMALGIALLASRIINLIYGIGFDSSVACLQILAFIVPMRYVNNTMGTALTATDRQGWRATVILLSAILNVTLNAFMIPAWSYLGASVSTVLTEIFILVTLYVTVRRRLPAVRPLDLIWRPLVSGLGMGCVVFWLREASLLLVVLVGVVTYVMALTGLKALPHEDLVHVKKTFLSFLQGTRWLWSKS